MTTKVSSTPAKWKTLVAMLAAFLAPFMVILGLRTWVFDLYFIPSPSMENTLMVGERIVVTRLNTNTPERGDIVVFRNVNDWAGYSTNETFVKRVIAVGGDTIYGDGTHVFVNDKPISEPYTVGVTEPFVEQQVPVGTVFLMGDNREESSDSRSKIGSTFGGRPAQFVPVTAIVGEYWFKY